MFDPMQKNVDDFLFLKGAQNAKTIEEKLNFCKEFIKKNDKPDNSSLNSYPSRKDLIYATKVASIDTIMRTDNGQFHESIFRNLENEIIQTRIYPHLERQSEDDPMTYARKFVVRLDLKKIIGE